MMMNVHFLEAFCKMCSFRRIGKWQNNTKICILWAKFTIQIKVKPVAIPFFCEFSQLNWKKQEIFMHFKPCYYVNKKVS